MTATKMQPVLTRLDHSHAHVTLDTLGMAKIVQVSEDSKNYSTSHEETDILEEAIGP